jgi:hypothetical protein
MSNQIQTKLGVKPGMRTLVVDAPPELVEALGLPDSSPTDTSTDVFNYIHLFALRQAKLDTAFSQLKKQLHNAGMLWVSWPKSGRLGTDLTLKHIIRIGYSHGLVESKTISLDSTWSAIKFTFPKPGKQYNNSYGVLKKDAS